jgi:hypothetical protein
MHTYDARVAPAEQRLLISTLQGVLPRAFALLEELCVASTLPLRCERLYLVGRSDHALELRADHAETDVALVDYWRLRVTPATDLRPSATLLRSLFDSVVADIQFTSGDELLESEAERISSHSQIVLRQASGRSVVITPADAVSGAIRLNVEV